VLSPHSRLSKQDFRLTSKGPRIHRGYRTRLDLIVAPSPLCSVGILWPGLPDWLHESCLPSVAGTPADCRRACPEPSRKDVTATKVFSLVA